jgi:hypothetical protein
MTKMSKLTASYRGGYMLLFLSLSPPLYTKTVNSWTPYHAK